MASQPNLLNSDSFNGGFRISTQVTPPNGKGVTWNQSATVSLNNGATKVSMNDNGQASITSFGQQVSISRGQTLQLGDGESVTYQQNGSLRVVAQNGDGGRIDTTLNPQGKGVNVDVTAHDVDLGGALVNGYERQPEPSGPVPVPEPIAPPIPGGPILAPLRCRSPSRSRAARLRCPTRLPSPSSSRDRCDARWELLVKTQGGRQVPMNVASFPASYTHSYSNK